MPDHAKEYSFDVVEVTMRAIESFLTNLKEGVGAVVRSLPSNPKVPGSISGSAESGIFGDLLSR